MIDSISFSLSDEKIPQLKGLEYSWGSNRKRTFKNLTLIQNPDSVYFAGSIAKFLNGENVTTLSRYSVAQALEKIEATFGWNLKNASLTKLEVGCTIPVKEPAFKYLSALGRIPRYKLLKISKNTLETVLNFTGNRSFIAYDKRIEAGKSIPPMFSGMELIRLELKIKKQLNKYLGECSPWDLVDPSLYHELQKQFRDFYYSVPKEKMPYLDLTEAVTLKDINNVLKAVGASLFADTLSDSLEDFVDQGKLGRVDRVRKSLNDTRNNPKYSDTTELIKELDAQVNAITMYI
jgi:hypothetical protein